MPTAKKLQEFFGLTEKEAKGAIRASEEFASGSREDSNSEIKETKEINKLKSEL